VNHIDSRIKMWKRFFTIDQKKEFFNFSLNWNSTPWTSFQIFPILSHTKTNHLKGSTLAIFKQHHGLLLITFCFQKPLSQRSILIGIPKQMLSNVHKVWLIRMHIVDTSTKNIKRIFFFHFHASRFHVSQQLNLFTSL
jgi:hypothetical protein